MRAAIPVLAVTVVVLSAGCNRPPPPVAPSAPAGKRIPSAVAAMPEPAKAAAAEPASKPAETARPLPPPPTPPAIDTPPAAPKAAPPREPERGPVQTTTEDPTASTACYTFRTMDHAKAEVFINGHKHATTSSLWSLTLNTVFDPKVTIDEWPPAGATFVGTAKRHTEDGFYVSTVELWMAGGKYDQKAFEDHSRRYPHLVDGEHLLFVKADLRGFKRSGALRVRLVGADGALYRWVDYRPTTLTDESDAERLFKRALWFERD